MASNNNDLSILSIESCKLEVLMNGNNNSKFENHQKTKFTLVRIKHSQGQSTCKCCICGVAFSNNDLPHTFLNNGTENLVCFENNATLLKSRSVHAFHHRCGQNLMLDVDSFSKSCISCQQNNNNNIAQNNQKQTNMNSNLKNEKQTTNTKQANTKQSKLKPLSSNNINNNNSTNEIRFGSDIGGVIICKSSQDEEDTFFGENYLDAKPEKDCFEVLSEIGNRIGGVQNIYLISKCGPSFQKKTMEWLDHVQFFKKTGGISKKNVNFCLERPQKAGICENLGITHFIDDRLDVLIHLLPVTSIKKLYLFNPAPIENQNHWLYFSPQITKINSWKDVLNDF